jgi:cobalamin biosynthesis protein CobD/CbiB
MTEQKKRVPWLLWPFVAIGRLIAWILQLTGRTVAAVLGLVLMIVGVILTVTVVGAVVGLPLLIFGFMLMVRSIF